ncbi:MAG: hypothetical protein RLZZ524_2130 [Pseudomonadota bacterium]|jgi:hypothetical protein
MTCAGCIDKPATCRLTRRGRRVWLCDACRETVKRFEARHGVRVGEYLREQKPGNLRLQRPLCWPRFLPPSTPTGLGGGNAWMRALPDLEQLDKRHADYSPLERWRERR